MSLFDIGHVAKLHEIQAARLRAGMPGIGPEVEALIRQLEMGGVNQRRIQAKRLWDKGIGPEVKAKNFKVYLADIPEIPQSLLADDPTLPFLSLADPRVGLVKACSLIGIQHAELGYSEGDAAPFDERHTDPTVPFWFRHDDGRENRGRRPDVCRDECTGGILVGTAITGAFVYLHHPEIVTEGEHIIDLPGSVHRVSRIVCAFLGVWEGQTRLVVDRNSGDVIPYYGSLRLRRK